MITTQLLLGLSLMPVPMQMPEVPNPPPAAGWMMQVAQGYGEPIQEGDLVTLDFAVWNDQGKQLANSQMRGLPFTFVVGEWRNDPMLDRVARGRKMGDDVLMRLSPDMAYGKRGVPFFVGPDSYLWVRVSVMQVGGRDADAGQPTNSMVPPWVP